MFNKLLLEDPRGPLTPTLREELYGNTSCMFAEMLGRHINV